MAIDPAPVDSTSNTLVFHLSDIHFGLVDEEAIAWVKREIAERRPDAVAITGDLTMRARHREFNAATRWIRSLDVPVTVEVGNHDLPYFNLIERFFTPYKRFKGVESVVEKELDLQSVILRNRNDFDGVCPDPFLCSGGQIS